VAVVPSEPPPPLPPAAPTANHQDGADSSIAARRRFDANKVVITIVGERAKDVPPPPPPPLQQQQQQQLAKQPLTPDWEKRLSAGRRAIEEQARLMQLPQTKHSLNSTTTTVVPVVPVVPGQQTLMIVDGRLPPVRKSNLQRSKIVQTLSIPAVPESSTGGGGGGGSAADHGQPKRITALKALQRLKSTLSSPALVDPAAEKTTPAVAAGESIQRRHDLLNGGHLLLANGKSGAVKKNLRRRLSGADDGHRQTDGSVMSSYQPLEVDLDDDAIMV
jgi:hypothetical protein